MPSHSSTAVKFSSFNDMFLALVQKFSHLKKLLSALQALFKQICTLQIVIDNILQFV